MTAKSRLVSLDSPGSKVSGGNFIFEKDVMIPMRDRLQLAADIFKPEADGDYPVIMTVSPYQKDIPWNVPDGHSAAQHAYQCWETPDPLQWVAEGYIVIRVDSRGAGKSPGYHEVWSTQEARDYYDAIEWAATQDWCNGNVGASGISYYAMSQWRVAALNPPSLKAIVPWGGGADMYRDTAYPGGMMNIDFLAIWYSRLVSDHHHTDSQLHNASYGNENALYHWIRNTLDNGYWRARSANIESIRVPFLSGMSWNDVGAGHLRGNTEAFKRAPAEHKQLLITSGSYFISYYGDAGFEAQRKWLAHWLKGEDTGVLEEPPVALSIRRKVSDPMAATIRTEQEWPIARTQYTPFYFSKTDDDNLTLEAELPVTADKVTYDAPGELPAGVSPIGIPPELQTAGIAFVSAPLAEEMELTGETNLILWATSSYDDMDLHIFLHVIYPDGSSEVAAKGWLKASQRRLDKKRSTPSRPYLTHGYMDKLTPGEIARMEVEIWPTSIILSEGSRLKLQVSGRAPGFLSDWHRRPRGTHTIHFGGDTPSHVLIPVVPAK